MSFCLRVQLRLAEVVSSLGDIFPKRALPASASEGARRRPRTNIVSADTHLALLKVKFSRASFDFVLPYSVGVIEFEVKRLPGCFPRSWVFWQLRSWFLALGRRLGFGEEH